MTWVSVYCEQFSVDFGHVFIGEGEEGCSSGGGEGVGGGDGAGGEEAVGGKTRG